MEGLIDGGGPEGADDQEETPPLTKEQIEGHVSALKSLIKSHNRKNKGDPIRLDFETVEAEIQGHTVVKGKEVIDEDLRKPFKEARRTPFTRRIIEFAGPEYKMSNNIKLYDGTTDPEDHLSRFAGAANSGEWPMPVWESHRKMTLPFNEMDTRPFRNAHRGSHEEMNSKTVTGEETHTVRIEQETIGPHTFLREENTTAGLHQCSPSIV
nr:reverse transcriptase domain-containing protein [Tanacetum cinerariifolium]